MQPTSEAAGRQSGPPRSALVVCTSMYDVEPRAQQSTAKHSATPPAQGSKPSSCRSEYVQKNACTYMHAASRLFSWSVELVASASRLFSPKMLDHLLYICNTSTCLFADERSGRNRCTCIQQLFNSRAVQQYIVCTSIYVVEPRAHQNTAKHSSAPLAAQSSIQSSTCRSDYVSKGVRTYMHASSRLFSWSKELLAFTRHLFAPKRLDHLLCTSVLSFQSILPSERA